MQAALGRAGPDGSLTPAGATTWPSTPTTPTRAGSTTSSAAPSTSGSGFARRVGLGGPDDPGGEPRASSAGLDPGQRTGYASPVTTATVATYLPPGAGLRGTRVDGRPVTSSVAEEVGRPLVRLDIALPAGRGVTVTVGYLVPAPAGRGRRHRHLRAGGGPAAHGSPAGAAGRGDALEGMVLRVGPRWTRRGSGASMTVRLATTIRDRIEAHRQ